MRLLAVVSLALSTFIAGAASAQTLPDERPGLNEEGPGGVSCMYPLGATDNRHVCDFMVYIQESKQNPYGALVLLQKMPTDDAEGVMRKVDTLNLSRVVPSGYEVLISQCGYQGRVDSAMIAMVKTSDAYKVPAVKACTVDFQGRELVELSDVQGITCEQGSGD
jgi:hypothetical protein